MDLWRSGASFFWSLAATTLRSFCRFPCRVSRRSVTTAMESRWPRDPSGQVFGGDSI
ncbi:hypothetical protein PF007_g15289 [Phytophthora fragariae]|uniref:Uncharacterized protein n=1 Tax=Phytophthora fragariae TaxID=53985 RepID=A0A6A4D9N2_9STRA|nr:hypothetical protein PF003_g34956 [Phytophthora fragariae]KAE9101061.1 hypothetical protein PF007_g15289 [Phytophthora fragariae]KAE9301642.1 hypothetical protein PF001_g14361 [Phytophthora fragariae]